MATDATEPLIESPAAARHAFVVLGMHRTGTSAMTRMLSLLGASLPKQLMGANESNPSGHWEPQTVADLNDEILQALDSEWDDVFAFRPKHYLSNFDRFYLGRAVESLAEGFDGSDVIVLKDPRISVLATFWDRVLGEAGFRAHYVIMVRNPIEVAESLRARDQFPLEKSLLLWSSYMVALERDTRGRPRTFVSYDQLMSDWRAARRRIEQDSGVPFARDTAAAANEIDRFLERGLRHHRARSDELSTRPEIPEHVKTLYGIFAAACEGAEIDVEAIAKIEAELGGVERLVGPILADLRSQGKSLAAENKRLDEAQADARGQVERLEAELVEAAALRGDLERLRVEQEELRAKLAANEQRLETEARIRREAESAVATWKELCEREQTRSAEMARAKEQIAAECNDLRLQIGVVERELELERAKIFAVEGSLEEARSEVAAIDARLNGRFHEIATLTNLLADRETSLTQAKEEANWLREAAAILLNDSTTTKGRLLKLLPAAVLSKRQGRLLRRRGLFDDEAYLSANADVAADGADPLRHYLNHGIKENRRRR